MTHDELTEIRQFYLASPVILPLIARLKAEALMKLVAKQRDGDSNFAPLVAEIAVLTRIEMEFRQKEQMYQAMEAKNANGR